MGKFIKGSLLIGNESNTYGCTSKKALMVVINTRNRDEHEDTIRVAILTSTRLGDIGDEYWVNESYFDYITPKDFFERVPTAPKLSPQKLTALRKKYGVAKYITSEGEANELLEIPEVEPYVLSEEQRTELIREMSEFLTHYRYHPTEKGLNKVLDEWLKNKADLIRLFEKHPNYNGKFQIVFDHDFDRTIDPNQAYEFSRWLQKAHKELLKQTQVKLGSYSYKELKNIVDRLYEMVQIFHYHDNIFSINGKDIKYYKEEYNRFSALLSKLYTENRAVCIKNGNAHDKKAYKELVEVMGYKLDYLVDFLENSRYIAQFVTSDAECRFSCFASEAKIKEGQKLSRAVNKICKMIGINKHPDYNKEFAKFADSVNPLKIKRHTVLSIHPIDYWSSSFGNSWTSCHSIDKYNVRERSQTSGGGYSAGTESYMLDGTSMVFYTVDAEYNGNQLELQDKINRNMFHFYDGQLLQARIYPQSCDENADDLYKDIREVVQKIFTDLLEVPNYWINKKGTNECGHVTESDGLHYKDYLYVSHSNVSTLKDYIPTHLIKIGHYPICPSCGETHKRSGSIECENCYY